MPKNSQIIQNIATMSRWLQSRQLDHITCKYSGAGDSGGVDDVLVSKTVDGQEVYLESLGLDKERLIYVGRGRIVTGIGRDLDFQAELGEVADAVHVELAMTNIFDAVIEDCLLEGYGDGDGAQGFFRIDNNGDAELHHTNNSEAEDTICVIHFNMDNLFPVGWKEDAVHEGCDLSDDSSFNDTQKQLKEFIRLAQEELMADKNKFAIELYGNIEDEDASYAEQTTIQQLSSNGYNEWVEVDFAPHLDIEAIQAYLHQEYMTADTDESIGIDMKLVITVEDACYTVVDRYADGDDEVYRMSARSAIKAPIKRKKQKLPQPRL